MQMTTTTNSSKQMNITGAEAIIHCLLAEGVDLIYGYPGGAIMPVYDELYKFQDKLTHILTRHEQGATHAAQGYARVSGKVGVAIATSGPGATNLVTAWRVGTTGVAIGAAGLPSLWDRRGETDLFGRELQVTQQAIGDEVATAASLLQGQTSEGRPVVHLRGLNFREFNTAYHRPASDLIRDISEDMFR